MKITHFLILALLSLTTGCNNDDNDQLDPVEQLPPITMVGAQTFGCLVDGEVTVPGTLGNNRFNAFYQNIDGFHYLGISINNEGGDDLVGISIQGTKTEPIEEAEYVLGSEGDGKFNGLLILGRPGDNFTQRTNDDRSGRLTITKHDTENFILSGTFEFKVLDDNGTEIKITDGRFDVIYTN